MKKGLIIVESPAKIKTLKKFFGGKYAYASSVGHIRDLPEKEFGIDVENNFEPKYILLADKKEVIAKLKNEAKKASVVYLSPDPDREGEAIAWHIASILPKTTKIQRTTFHSLTKSEVIKGLENPRTIDQALVDAQQARRLLDRIVGYKISPILSRKIKRGKPISAGRVQSVALKFIVDREKEIEAFVSKEYWNIYAILSPGKSSQEFSSYLYSVDGKKVDKEQSDKKDLFTIDSEKIAKELQKKLEKATYAVQSIEKKDKKRHPYPPFITSTLQQEASRHYGFSATRTMNIAQSLYEGVDMKDEGTEGLITYMRTDSVQTAPEAVQAARKFIEKEYGKQFLPEKPNFYKSKKSAQEAHEAIRPTNLYHPPEMIKKHLNSDQYKIYLLIWQRFMASQMSEAIYDTISATIETDKDMIFKASGSMIKFQGFLAAYEEKSDGSEETNENKLLPPLTEGQTLTLKELKPEQSFTKPPPRYTEASLIKELEKSGIGRPSTYASIMVKIQSRDYTIKDKLALKPTELGKVVIEMMEQSFTPIVNAGFTAAMEDDLELVAENKRKWKELIKEFWGEFDPMVETAKKEAFVPKVLTKKKCPKCDKFLQKIWSKEKYFYGCSGYPDCDFTSPMELVDFKKEDYAEDFNWEQNCPKCQGKMNIRHGKFGPFLGCANYPKCRGIVNIPKKGEIILSYEESPDCPALGCDGKIVQRKTRYGKTFFSCSNFPECNVIVNNIDDLEKKYDANHPKTAYVKKEGFQRGKGKRYEYTISKELEKIVEEKKLTRGEVLKRVWKYIKKHKLQDKKNKRLIVPDKNLQAIFKTKEPVDMMQLAKFLKDHLS